MRPLGKGVWLIVVSGPEKIFPYQKQQREKQLTKLNLENPGGLRETAVDHRGPLGTVEQIAERQVDGNYVGRIAAQVSSSVRAGVRACGRVSFC